MEWFSRYNAKKNKGVLQSIIMLPFVLNVCVHVWLYTHINTITTYTCIYYIYTHYLEKGDKVTIESSYI